MWAKPHIFQQKPTVFFYSFVNSVVNNLSMIFKKPNNTIFTCKAVNLGVPMSNTRQNLTRTQLNFQLLHRKNRKMTKT